MLPAVPEGREPVVRFKTPLGGVTKWVDLVKGEIAIPNEALDDLIIARADGTLCLDVRRAALGRLVVLPTDGFLPRRPGCTLNHGVPRCRILRSRPTGRVDCNARAVCGETFSGHPLHARRSPAAAPANADKSRNLRASVRSGARSATLRRAPVTYFVNAGPQRHPSDVRHSSDAPAVGTRHSGCRRACASAAPSGSARVSRVAGRVGHA